MNKTYKASALMEKEKSGVLKDKNQELSHTYKISADKGSGLKSRVQTATYTGWAGKISPRRWHWSGDLNDREGQVLPSILDTKEQFVRKPQAQAGNTFLIHLPLENHGSIECLCLPSSLLTTVSL